MSKRVRVALLNRTGLVLLALSCVLTAAVLVVPPLARWSSWAPFLILVGFVAYILTVLVVAMVEDQPEVRPLLSIRRSMAERLAELKAAPSGRGSALVPVVADAVRHVDSQFVPTFRGIVVRHHALGRHIAEYKTGKMAAPDPENLDRLRRIYQRQDEALGACIRQASNAYATLIALLQEADDAGVIEQARLWTSDLNDIYDGLAEVLSGVDPYEQAILQLRLDTGTGKPVQPLIEEALEKVEPAVYAPRPPDSAPAATCAFPDGLTQREAEVLALLADGLTSREIADRLVVTVATVSRHIANIYNKINARGRADATRFAMQHGITSTALFSRADGKSPSDGRTFSPRVDFQRPGGATA